MSEHLLSDDDSSVRILPAMAGSAETDSKLRQFRILAVEDIDPDFALLREFLAESGGTRFVLERAVSLQESYERLAENRYDLVLLDLGLPGSRGIETFRNFRFHASDLPVVVLSGLDDEAVVHEAVRDGAQDYLVKGSFDSDSLARSVRYSLERHRAQEKLRAAVRRAKSSEASYRSVTQSANDAIIVTDSSGTIVSWNHGARTIFGYDEDEVQGKKLTTLMPERFREIHTRGIERYARTKEPRIIGQTVELTGLRKDNTEFPLELSISTWKSSNGRCFSGIIRDITDRKRAEADRFAIKLASEIQRTLYPAADPSLPGFDIAGAAYPADRVSGDCYDFIPMSEQSIGLVAADVSGHGFGPSLLMAQTQAYLHALAEIHDDPGDILTHTNRLLPVGESGRFVTLFFAQLDAQSNSLTFACAAHKAFHFDHTGKATVLKSKNTALGVIPDQDFKSASSITLAPGDIVFLPTDGIEEAMAPDETLFGEDRMLEVVRRNRDRSSREIVQSLYSAARGFTAGGVQRDDITAIVVKVLDHH